MTDVNIERVIGPEFPGKYKHPASIEELANGDLYIAYYGGDGEYAEQTAVLRHATEEGRDQMVDAQDHRRHAVSLRRQRRDLAGARWAGVAVLRVPLWRHLEHVAHQGQDLARRRAKPGAIRSWSRWKKG